MAMRGISGDAHFFEESMNLDRLRKLLDNKLGVAGHSEKLEAMKSLLASISKGEDVSMFFADVVKNVIVASVEVKKLVYMYLVHYADANAQCRELALLSINSFQKDLADANQLIRALALRVMTSIRVRDILQIQLIAIRKCAADSSPYVRKCAANAISKVYAVDADQKDVLAEIIGKLLHDASTMVLGSAMQALNEVCPDRLDLLHRPFRKLCHLLADIEEWGQVVTINVFIRYCREQFQTPETMALNQDTMASSSNSSSHNGGRKDAKLVFPKRKAKRTFYSDDEGGDSDSDTSRMSKNGSGPSPFHLGSAGAPRGEALPSIGSVFRSNALASGIGGGEELDEDHRLLLRSSIPLLKSRNSAVVLAVATLHYYCGTHSVATNTLIGKSLVRIMRNQREIQYVVLTVISSMSISRPDMFRPFLQDFFVRATDPSYARKLKLEIMTTLVTDDNVSIILREFQAYVRHVDKSFVTMTVRALGRVADAMSSVAERCLNGLMRLVRSSNEQVVAESVVVIRQLLQQSTVEKDRMRVVRSLAAMMVSGRVVSPSARASIVWMLGEFHQEGNGWVCAAETLRLIAKTFSDEATEVRLQVLNLAVKLGLHEPQKRNIQLLLQYVIELCKFDADYDVRDRARLVRAALSGDANIVNPHKVFATKKPAPLIGYEEESKSRFTLGTLSSVVRHSVPGYAPIPSWRQSKPDRSLRDETSFAENDREPESSGSINNRKGGKKPKNDTRKVKDTGFYSSDDSGSDDDESESDSEADSDASSNGSGSGSGSGSYSGSGSESDSGSDDSSNAENSENDSDEQAEEDASSSEDSEDERRRRRSNRKSAQKDKQKKQPQPVATLVDPFDPMNFLSGPTGGNAPMANTNNFMGGDSYAPIGGGTGSRHSNNLIGDLMSLSMMAPAGAATKRELLSSLTGNGLEIQYSFLRQPSMYSPNMNLVQLWLSNQSPQAIPRVRVVAKQENTGTKVVSFPEIPVLFPGSTPSMAQIHVDFGGQLDQIELQVVADDATFDVELVPVAGELLTPQQMSLEEFVHRISMADQSALHTTDFFVDAPVALNGMVQATLTDCNLAQVYEINNTNGATGKNKFAGRLRGTNDVVLVGMEFQIQSGKTKLLVVAENASLAQRISASIKRHLPIRQA